MWLPNTLFAVRDKMNVPTMLRLALKIGQV